MSCATSSDPKERPSCADLLKHPFVTLQPLLPKIKDKQKEIVRPVKAETRPEIQARASAKPDDRLHDKQRRREDPAESGNHGCAEECPREEAERSTSSATVPSTGGHDAAAIDPATAGLAGGEKRRGRHVARACQHCKKAHLACDEQRPCKRCVRLGKTDCRDVEHKRRGRSVAFASPGTLDREAASSPLGSYQPLQPKTPPTSLQLFESSSSSASWMGTPVDQAEQQRRDILLDLVNATATQHVHPEATTGLPNWMESSLDSDYSPEWGNSQTTMEPAPRRTKRNRDRPKGSFACTECSERFKRHEHLERHMISHSGERRKFAPWICR